MGARTMEELLDEQNQTIKGLQRRPTTNYGPALEAVRGRLSDLEEPVAFRVTHSTSFTGSGAQALRLLNWNTIYQNQGGHWDGTNSRFVVPYDGYYEFDLSICQATDVGGPEGFIYLNGNPAVGGGGVIAYSNHVTATVIYKLELQAGDLIQAYWRNNNGTNVTIDGTRSYFAGKILWRYDV